MFCDSPQTDDDYDIRNALLKERRSISLSILADFLRHAIVTESQGYTVVSCPLGLWEVRASHRDAAWKSGLITFQDYHLMGKYVKLTAPYHPKDSVFGTLQ